MPGLEKTIRREVSPSPCRPAVVAVASFMVGVLLHSCVSHYPQIWLALLLILAISAALLVHRGHFCSLLLILALLCGGVALGQIEAFYYPRDDISAYATDDPRLAWLELQIDHEPRILSDPFSAHPLPPKQVVNASVTRIKTWNGWVECSGEILVQISQPHPQLAINQRVRVLGTLERPAPAMNPGQFDWAKYYREQRILASLHVNAARNIAILGNTYTGPFDYLRARSRELLAEGFTTNRSLDYSVLHALLLGDKDPELRDIQEQFRRTGTSHHLSISGMHIAVLGGFVYGICRLFRLRPRAAVIIGMTFTVTYGIVALPSPPVVRSVLLCLFFGFGVLLHRTRDPIQLLSLSVLAMLIYHPMDLYNPGFQLGIGTVLALMIFVRPFLKWVHRNDEPFDPRRKLTIRQRLSQRAGRGFTDAFYTALLAWFVSAPLIVYHFNQINFWAMVGGLVLAPFVFASLIGGMLKVLLTALWPSAAAASAVVACWPVDGMRWTLGWLARIPGSDYPVPSMPLWQLIGIYALFFLMLVPTKRPKLWWLFKAIPITTSVIALLLPFWRGRPTLASDELTVTLLSLGAGQCAVVETPAGRTIMIDAGTSSYSDVLGKCIGPYLRTSQHTQVDSMLLTHSDYDHISAAGAIAQVYEVREVMVGSRFREHAQSSAPAEALLRTLDALDIPPRVVTPGERIPLGRGAEIEILWPPKSGAELSSNDSAVVAQLRYAGRSILFTGDIQEPAEKGLLASRDLLRADVLIAPHHGSSESTTPEFVRAVNPTYVLSSNDRSLSGKQKHFEQMVGAAQLFRTNRCGAITVHIRKDGTLSVETFIKPAS